ncbi:hypothetical protein [Dactylosporangium sp. NPDC005555]|uniref:hypothetical protein n=1 Tax=Dactylosporangium sp. NPDC005555 TaxID=3154889 RepID=UPI0033AF6BC6
MRATTVLDAPSNLGLRPSLAASGCVDPDLDPDGRIGTPAGYADLLAALHAPGQR